VSQLVSKVVAFEKLHHHEWQAIGHYIHVQNAGDMAAAKIGRSPGFTIEPLDDGRRGEHPGQEHLDRDTLAELRVLALEDDAHAALPKHTNELVFASNDLTEFGQAGARG
jgi:hypothetical protein